MDALLQREGVALRLWLQSADLDAFSADALRSIDDPEVRFLLDHSIVVLQDEPEKRFPKPPWRVDIALDHTELIHHAIKRLLLRKQANANDTRNLLTLGYREVLPGATGHRLAHSNDVMCYYPNTLVGVLKRPCWQALHSLMGDTLMIHLLLHYAIFTKLRKPKGSYLQICGKSICFTPFKPPSAIATGTQPKTKPAKFKSGNGRVCTINEVLYSRHEQEQVFGRSNALMGASKLGSISRGAAERVIRSIFTRHKTQKRLPKRFIRLIPIIQELISRFKKVDPRELTKQIVRVPPMFRKYMSDHPKLKLAVSVAKQERREEVQGSPCHPMQLKALNDGYMSQDESLSALSERKRKRRQDAIEARSNASSCRGEALPTTLDINSGRKRQRPIALQQCNNVMIGPIPPEYKQEIVHLLQFTVPKRKICRLVSKFVAMVVPKAIWGTPDSNNWKCVKKLIRRFIYSRKYDVLSIKQSAYHEFSVKSISWMDSQVQASQCPPNELTKRHELVQELLAWLLTSVVFPLLRDLFYITECEGTANEIVFFQRSVWSIISSLVLRDLGGSILHPVHNSASLTGLERKLATSRLRLLPKVNGVRPLMNLASSIDPKTQSVNRSLEMLHRVIVFEMERQSKRLLGASVRNLDEIYARLKPLIQQIRSCAKCMQRRKTNPDAPLLYCASVDIAQCFDNIRPAKLYQIVKKMILEEEYLVRKHWVFQQTAPAASTSSHHNSKSGARKNKFFKVERPAFTSGDLKCFDDIVADCRTRNAIFVDGVLYDYLTKDAILRLLKEHLLSNVVQYQNRSYVQRQGIPQGSVLSTTLCNLYMAHFERRVLWKQMEAQSSELKHSAHCGESDEHHNSETSCCCEGHEAILRYTDDFLFLSSDVTRANGFIELMHQGNDDYGCYVNSSKSRVNFEAFVVTQNGSLQSVPRFDLDGEGLLAWCGLLLDPKALQIGINLEKLRGPIMQASIPVDETKALHGFLVTKALASIRQRWHSLYFDPTLLSRATIHANLSQTLTLAAMRFVLLLGRLPRVNGDRRFFFESIRRILNKTTRGIYRSLQRTDSAHKSSAMDLNERTHRWHMYQALQQSVWRIGLHAFALILKIRLDSPQQSPSHRALWLDLLELVESELQRQLEKEQGQSSDQSSLITQEELQLLSKEPRNVVLLDWIR